MPQPMRRAPRRPLPAPPALLNTLSLRLPHVTGSALRCAGRALGELAKTSTTAGPNPASVFEGSALSSIFNQRAIRHLRVIHPPLPHRCALP
jgi:hypothetical protein